MLTFVLLSAGAGVTAQLPPGPSTSNLPHSSFGASGHPASRVTVTRNATKLVLDLFHDAISLNANVSYLKSILPERFQMSPNGGQSFAGTIAAVRRLDKNCNGMNGLGYTQLTESSRRPSYDIHPH